MHYVVKCTLFILISAVSIIPLTRITISRVEKHTFFPNFAVFDTLFNVCAILTVGKKKTTLFTCFLVKHHIHHWIQSVPPPNLKLAVMLMQSGGCCASMPTHLFVVCMLCEIKGIFSDFNKIILWHKSTDIKKKRLFPKFQLILIFRLQVMHDYVH